jgi:hypothetical protein
VGNNRTDPKTDRKPRIVRTRRSTDRTQASGFRRATAVLVSAGVLVCAPGIAQAVFKGTATGQVSASTLSLVEPVGANITIVCDAGKKLSITVNSYGSVPGATSLKYTVTGPSGPTFDPGATYTLHPAAQGRWTAKIWGERAIPGAQPWTGVPYSRTADC